MQPSSVWPSGCVLRAHSLAAQATSPPKQKKTSRTKHYDGSFFLQCCASRGNPAPSLRKNQVALKVHPAFALKKESAPSTQWPRLIANGSIFPLTIFRNVVRLLLYEITPPIR